MGETGSQKAEHLVRMHEAVHGYAATAGGRADAFFHRPGLNNHRRRNRTKPEGDVVLPGVRKFQGVGMIEAGEGGSHRGWWG